MSTVEEHFAALRAMKPREGGWMTEEFQFHAVLLLGAHLDELEAAWKAHHPEDTAIEPTREAAPSGWRMVPDTPTAEMLLAFTMSMANTDMGLRGASNNVRKYWKAMLAAAPSPAESRPNGDTGSEAQAEHREANPSPTPTAEEVARIIAGFSEPLPGDPGSAHDHWEICLAKAARVLRLFQPEGVSGHE